MPELAEVHYYRKQWEPGLGETVRAVETHPKARIFREVAASAIERGLLGETFRGSHGHGKRMLFEFSSGFWLGLHLGMTGKLFTAPLDHEVAKADHLVLRMGTLTLVFADSRMFGKLTLEQTEESREPEWWSSLPPQPQERAFSAKWVATFVKRFPKTPVKTALLDQRGFPGIGNWMADEICWRMRLLPQTLCGELSDADRVELARVTREVARDAMKVIGEDWSRPPDRWLMNHRWKDGGICPRRGCRDELIREDLRGRTTCWCESCATR
ncbi:MAG: DNA-formamidopyrimidine glycosylase family protein [Verrucomicrobiota bacterium]